MCELLGINILIICFLIFDHDPRVGNLTVLFVNHRRTIDSRLSAFVCSCHFINAKNEDGPTI